MRRILLTLSAVLTLSLLTACHTVEGMGKDIKSAGGAIEDVGSKR